MKSRRLKALAGTGWLLVAVVVGLLAYHYLSRPERPALRQAPVELERLAADCRAGRATCSAGTESVRVDLALGPGVPLMQPFPVRVSLRLPSAGRARQVLVDFRMIGMDMGRNEYRLTRAGDGTWQGVATLPVCTTGRSDWQAVVKVETASGRRYRAVFPFEAE